MKFKINGVEWTLENVPPSHDIFERMAYCGKIRQWEAKAYLSTDLPKHRLNPVWIHELVHICLMDSGLNNLLDKNMEEAICDSIGQGLSSLIRDSGEKVLNLLK